ncbi:FG-GAP repeat domain-containing protein [Frigoriglobus tundricola]|uniref:Uncharacterized protein n=1 Tax=Frigoriglobus tundricola TaxID=2774151 RepID=A0A6M5Z2K1_9BACT|nr:VCBS repeat-containing protein [Frigoriglobus tundricola]QJW99753.1 hypothetical protein FTUN_7376 [Frigoriglobus tundricola]
MARLRFGAALGLLWAASAAAAAQPGKPPPVVQFKQFGATPEQFYQSSVTRWTSQLALDLEAVKGDVAKLPPPVRAAITTPADAALRHTAELEQFIRRGAPKEKLFAEFSEVERALNALAGAVAQNPIAGQAAAGPLGRTDSAFHQLATALGAGDNDPGRLKRRLIRLGEALDDGAEDLRTHVGDQHPNEKALERALGLYSREARLFARRVRDDADAGTLARSYAAMGERWAEAVTLFGRVRPLPPGVLAQAVKVDGLHRRAGSILNLPPFPPGTNPLLPTGKTFAYAVGAEVTGDPHVIVYADDKGTVAYSFLAYEKVFDGGVRVDMADLNGDGVADLIVAPGPGKAPVSLPVKVYDGRDLHLLVEFQPFPGFRGGLLARGTDLTKDGRALVAVTADDSNHIKVYDLAQGKEVASFFAHDPKRVTGGVRIAWGDINADGVPDILTVNGPGNAVTTVKVFNGKSAEVLAEFPVLDGKYKGGAFIAAVDLAGNGQMSPVIGLDAGAVPLVRVFDGKGKPLVEWLAFDDKFRGGVRVGVSARNRIVTGPGLGMKNSPVRIFDVTRPKAPPIEIVPFPGFDGGINVGGR